MEDFQLSRDDIYEIAKSDSGIQPPRKIQLQSGDIWWSGIIGAISVPFLRDKGIKHIINLGVPLEESLINELKINSELKSYTYYSVYDSNDQNILPASLSALWIVESAHRNNEPVLIHCFAGRNRSGAAIAKIISEEFIKTKKLKPYDAMLSAIKYLRIITNGYALTNNSFILQLLDHAKE